MDHKLGIVTGLEIEVRIVHAAAAEIAEPLRPLVGQGYGPEDAASAARGLIGGGATALLSLGFAGALSPVLKTGDVVVAKFVKDELGAEIEADSGWCARARNLLSLPDLSRGTILSMMGVAADADYKRELFNRYGAVAVDMESHAVAGAARIAGLPFLAIRIILDEAASGIPPAAVAGVDETGKVRPARSAAALAKRPQDLAAVMKLGRDTATAKAVLGRVAGLGMPLFGLG